MSDKTPPPPQETDPDWDDAAPAAAPAPDPAPPEMHTDGILTKAEAEEIQRQAKAEILKMRTQSAKRQLLEAEKARLLSEEGLVTGIGVKDELVSITIDVAEFAPGIVVNMRPYWHGHTYQVPRHLAETLREIMQRTHLHQNSVDGKDMKHFYHNARATTLSPTGAKNAPKRPDAH